LYIFARLLQTTIVVEAAMPTGQYPIMALPEAPKIVAIEFAMASRESVAGS
jgi:hypothetical protein